MIQKLFLCRASSLSLKGTEAPYEIMPSIVCLVVDTFMTMSSLLEESDRQLEAEKVSGSEDTQ